MITTLRSRSRQVNLAAALVAIVVLALAFLLGQHASLRWLTLIVGSIGGVVLLARPALGLFALLAAALLLPLEFGTGTDVQLNPVSLLLPVLLGLWLLVMIRRRQMHFVSSPVNRPLILFLAANLLSLLVGRATWDPMVPVKGNFLLVQLAQWAIFAFSAGAFWLAANLLPSEAALRRLTRALLLVGGLVAIAVAVLGIDAVVGRFATIAAIRAPFWILLTGLAGGQLLFDRQASPPWRAFLIALLLAVIFYAFRLQQEAVSNWVGVAAVASALVWLRWPRLRWPIAVVVTVLIVLGILFPSIYEFAGGDVEWQGSGGSRLALIERVVDVTMRNPITGLGPAAYRPYANATPLLYGRALWTNPLINSHNNYVDIFAHTGLVGLALFLWFMAEIAWLAWRLRRRFQHGFVAGYVNGMLTAWAGIMVVMLFLDWFLPFVYNVQFAGFQASVLVWLFLGGLVAIENWGVGDEGKEGKQGNQGKDTEQERIRLINERMSDG